MTKLIVAFWNFAIAPKNVGFPRKKIIFIDIIFEI
jgi:hypothetical protein